MGAMKSVRTAITLNMFPANPEERATYNHIAACEKRYNQAVLEQSEANKRRFDEEDAIDTIYMRHVYVGNIPSKAGKYAVLDMDTGSVQFVNVDCTSSQMLVQTIGVRGPEKLEYFNLRCYRWFRLTPFVQADMAEVRTLPIKQQSVRIHA